MPKLIKNNGLLQLSHKKVVRKIVHNYLLSQIAERSRMIPSIQRDEQVDKGSSAEKIEIYR